LAVSGDGFCVQDAIGGLPCFAVPVVYFSAGIATICRIYRRANQGSGGRSGAGSTLRVEYLRIVAANVGANARGYTRVHFIAS